MGFRGSRIATTGGGARSGSFAESWSSRLGGKTCHSGGGLVDSLEDGVRLANWVAAWVIWGAEEPAFAGVSEERDAVGK